MTGPKLTLSQTRIGVIGLGYVGLPLALAFAEHFPIVGLDSDEQRVAELLLGRDRFSEVEPQQLADAELLRITGEPRELAGCNLFIVTVPTPIDKHKRPDLRPLMEASEILGRLLQPGQLAVFESTVYPGCTEEVCVPIIERVSGLRYQRDFHVGYSPERVNPGDRHHRLTDIVKITSGSSPEVADFVDELYGRILTAGTHKAGSIRVAEAAKVIENTQRDVNIALVNELALIFNRLGIDTEEVLEAAQTKWNFLPFRPGLVGGHCIGVDSYYLTHKAEEICYHPQVILAGRRINDDMGAYVARRVVKMMTERDIHVAGSRVLVLGLAFKENCPDLRNTRVVDMVREFHAYSASVDVYDPWVDPNAARREYDIRPIETPANGRYHAVVVAVAHDRFRQMGAAKIRALGRPGSVLFDVKCLLPRADVDARL